MPQFSYDDTFSKVADTIADKLGIEKSRITKDATMADLGADSLDLAEMSMNFEEQFGMEISDEDAEKMNNINNVVDYIQQRRTK
jgi:acyl carrier protein